MNNSLFEEVRKYEDYIAGCMEDVQDNLENLIALCSGYACAYIGFFEEVKTDAADSMMLLKIYLSTLKKFERVITVLAIRKMKWNGGDKNE